MVIIYDVVTKSVFVEFRGKFKVLFGPYTRRRAGITAGEDYCRNLGWVADAGNAPVKN